MKNLVVGCGFSGATMANLVASYLGEDVLVIDKKNHIAGNSYDYFDKNGICIHKYGSHIFHTNEYKVWNYVNKFTKFNNYQHKVFAIIDDIETTIPFNLNTLYDVFLNDKAKRLEEKLLAKFKYGTKIPILEFQNQSDEELKQLAEFVYEKIFLHYTTKQWGKSPEKINGSITARVPIYISKDDRYFQDKFQGIPINGYSVLVHKMLSLPNIQLKLNTDYKNINLTDFDRIFYTGTIDEFFDYNLGELPYRSLVFDIQELSQEFYQLNPVVNYPSNNCDFTRIHEYKYYLNNKSLKTVIAKEFPQSFINGKNERYYPIVNDENILLYQRYLLQSKQLNNVYFFGRLGDYKYYDIDKAILRAINLFEDVFKIKI